VPQITFSSTSNGPYILASLRLSIRSHRHLFSSNWHLREVQICSALQSPENSSITYIIAHTPPRAIISTLGRQLSRSHELWTKSWHRGTLYTQQLYAHLFDNFYHTFYYYSKEKNHSREKKRLPCERT
jgi:hypothetical protein